MNKRAVVVIIGVIVLVVLLAAGYKVVSMVVAPRPAASANEIEKENGTLLFEKAQGFIAEGELLKARSAYKKILEKFPNSADIQKAQENLENLNIQILLSSIMTDDAFTYQVQKGDTLTAIAKKFNTTVDLIMKSNSLKDTSLRIGKNLKITKRKFSIVVDKSQNILTLKSDQDIFKTYRVSTGKNSCTPVGNFKIITRIVNPPWYPPNGGVIPAGDPKNVLGSRWLGLSKPSYGIHGTIQPESIGKSVTEGCVRMKNTEVEELFTIVPEGTEVTIVD